MKLSIIIVNYNVRYFLEQCLLSVERAISGIDAEVWVVDNRSSDDSMAMVRNSFPWVNVIENDDNVGFAKANNQAARASDSEFILLLNPDTIVPEDNLRKALSYMEKHPECGALGVRMYDGSGQYLPESKRGLPTPWVAFYKIFGLSSLFPRSEKFARYHMGHLSSDDNQRVEILAGAYMLMRRKAWDKAGELDETYFMYGEDIDLSYSIEKAGYEVHYLADAPIIHYKGESTKKGSLNYVFLFYNAMLIFARKHLSKGYARTFGVLIRFAIYLRAAMSVTRRIIKRISLPLLDLILFWGGMQLVIRYWELNHRFIEGGSYPGLYKWGITPLYGLLWISGLILLGAYRRPIRLNRVLMGLALGTAFIFGLYALSPDEYRFSRALILLGSAWMTFSVLLLRFGLSFIPSSQTGLWKTDQRRVCFIGNPDHEAFVRSVVRENGETPVVFEKTDVSAARTVCAALDITEIVFDGEEMSYSDITNCMASWNDLGLKFFIAYPSGGWMIGSDSINTRGKAVGQNKYALSDPQVLRSKRTFDILVVLFLWLLTPIALWMPRLSRLWWNSFSVLFGARTWVGYGIRKSGLPGIKRGVIPIKDLDDNNLQNLADDTYARTADVNVDARTLIRYLRLGQ